VIIATPVAPPETMRQLEAAVDQVVCLMQPQWFPGLGAFYTDFHQLEDREVVAFLEAAKRAGARRDS